MKVCVFGAGGVGGYLGARLAEAGVEVHLIARGEHLEAIERDGLHLESVAGDVTVEVPATDDPTEIGTCDVILFCVKTYDTDEAAEALDPLLGADTAVISFQNGVDNEHRIDQIVGEGHAVGGVAKIFSTISDPGVITHTGGPAQFIYGEFTGERSPRLEAFDDAITACRGVEGVLSDDITVELWRKLAFICAQSGMTAATRCSIGTIRSTAATWSMYRQTIEEVVDVARARGVTLPAGTTDELVAFAESLDADMTSSLLYDLEHGNRMELEALCGSVVRHGDETGVAVSMNEALYGVLAPWATGE